MPPSTWRSRSVATDGTPASLGGPAKNDVLVDAESQTVGRQRVY